MNSTARHTPSGWLQASGEMGRMIKEHPWTQTKFGPLEEWPAYLRFAVNFILGSQAPMAIIWGPDRQFLYNDAYRQILQDKHAMALGSAGRSIFPELWEQILPFVEQAYGGESVVLDEIALPLTRHGVTKTLYFTGTYNPLRDEEGNVHGFVAVVVDTTRRVTREFERAQVFDTILSAITDFAYSFDREGRFVFVNKALLDLWGIPLEQALGKNFFELNYPRELAARLQAQIEEVYQSEKTVRDETSYQSPAGKTGYYEYIFHPVFDHEGKVSLVVGSTREITHRKNLEEQLREVHGRMEAALSAGLMGSWSWEVKNDRVFADSSLANFFSVSPVQANGGPIKHYLAAVHPDDRERVAKKIQDALVQGSHYDTEYRLVGKSGEIRWVEARGSVQRDSLGVAISVPGMVLDITARKKLEDRIRESIQELEKAKGTLEKQTIELEGIVSERTARLQETITELESFSYSISHDLRGPLRVMQSFAQALREDCADELNAVGNDYIRRIVAAAERMDRIIQDVLVYSRTARTDLVLEPIDLALFIPSMIEGYPGFDAARADISIKGVLPIVLGNSAGLSQCLSNLLGNAVKFVKPGTRPVIEISAVSKSGRAWVSVRDQGIGIAKRAHEQIFEVFNKLNPGYEGTGIGLAIVRKALERMGGSITVESETGQGSVFTFDLPLAAIFPPS